jgi:hypothetical protein
MVMLIVVLPTHTEFAIAALYRRIKIIKERGYADKVVVGVSNHYTDFHNIGRNLCA